MNDSKILFVDDDQNILSGYQRQLRQHFRVETANGPKQGLEVLAASGPFAVVVSDMRMPDMNGIQFLACVKHEAPETVRMMLTGNSDQQTAIDALNSGGIFRFLNKPCSRETMIQVLTLGLEQHRLLTAERALLSRTLGGSVSLLTEILSLVNPTAFGRASRAKRLVATICERLHLANVWEVELAAMLSQVGCVTVPEATLARHASGLPLSPDEAEIFKTHPELGRRLVERIPRLENVAAIIGQQDTCNLEAPTADEQAERIRIAGNVLKSALDFDAMVGGGKPPAEAIAWMQQRSDLYLPDIIRALAAAMLRTLEPRLLMVADLAVGMIVDENIETLSTGQTLLARGQEIVPWMRERLRNFARTQGVREPFRVLCRTETTTESTAETTSVTDSNSEVPASPVDLEAVAS